MSDSSPSSSEDEIYLREMIVPIWKARKQILIIAIIFTILGGIIGFLTPVKYTASSTFLPQTSQSGAGGLNGLAALAGVNVITSNSGGEISPSMYSKVLGSEPFRMQILDSKLWVNSDSVTYRSYLENQPASLLGTIQQYTIGLPGLFIGLFSTKEEVKIIANDPKETQILSKNDYGLLGTVSSNVSISYDKKEGVISISGTERDPIIAMQLTKATEKVLLAWINEFKVKNAKKQFDFINKLFLEKEKEHVLKQNQLATFIDQNRNVVSNTYLIKLNRLQSEFDLINQVYLELAKQKEQAAIQLSKETPTFIFLDPVKLPRENSGIRKRVYVMSSFFAGFILSIFWIIIQKPVVEFFKKAQSYY
jgi:hypothetical protein